MLFQCCASVEDGGPTLKRHWGNARVCLVGPAFRACAVKAVYSALKPDIVLY